MTQEHTLQAGDLIRTQYLKIDTQPWAWVYCYFLVIEAEPDSLKTLSMQDGTVSSRPPEWLRLADAYVVSRPDPEPKTDGGQA